MKKFLSGLLAFAILFAGGLFLPQQALAHTGGIDENGGHNKTSDGTYHYHLGGDRIVEYPYAPEAVKVMLNGREIIFDGTSAVIMNGRTLVPMRAIFEALGAEVSWFEETWEIRAIKPPIGIMLQIDNPKMTVVSNISDSKAEAEEITLDVPPMLVGGRTLVPVRAVAEGLNCEVYWDDAARTVIIVGDNVPVGATGGPPSALASAISEPAADQTGYGELPEDALGWIWITRFNVHNGEDWIAVEGKHAYHRFNRIFRLYYIMVEGKEYYIQEIYVYKTEPRE